jgi:hypothetical protein
MKMRWMYASLAISIALAGCDARGGAVGGADGSNAADGAAGESIDLAGAAAGDGNLPQADGGGAGTGGFQHPGVLVDRGQLDFVKAQLAAGAEPWKSALAAVTASPLASLAYTPHPIAVVQCGSFSNPDIGCTDEKNDAAAAYTHALLWYYGGDPQHAQKAIAIMNAWASTLTAHQLSNAPLQSAWVASLWPRAAEIIRWSNAGWSATDADKFGKWLETVYLPEVVAGSASNGNWELSMIEATIGIAVFRDDAQTFAGAVAMWKKRVPAYVYLVSDGAAPVGPPTGGAKTGAALLAFWYNPAKLVDGLSQETCRDLGHAQYGLAAMTNAAETARIQGVDLYALESKRLAAAYELHATWLAGDGGANANLLCGVALNAVTPDPMWEIALNAVGARLGVSLPETQKLVAKIRPTGSNHHMEWETLTHGAIGSAGIQ